MSSTLEVFEVVVVDKVFKATKNESVRIRGEAVEIG